MPHITTYGGTYFSAQHVDELTGTFDGLNKTTSFDDKGMRSVSGVDVFKPKDIDTKGSVIAKDNHFTTGGGGDSITGEGRPMNVWINGSATSFEDRDYGATTYVDGFLKLGDIKGELQTTGLRSENRFVIERFASGGAVESFEPFVGMNSFGESLNPVLVDRLNWSELCDVGLLVRRAEVMPRFAIV